MSEEEKELVNNCKIWVQEEDIDYTRWFGLNELSVLVNLIEKQDKIIDLMAEYLADIDFDECCAEIPEPCLGCSWEDYEPHTNCIKEYFRKKVENERNKI